MTQLHERISLFAKANFHKEINDLSPVQLHEAVSKMVISEIAPAWQKSKCLHDTNRRAYYLSAEFLVGRAVYNNLLCTGLYEDAEKALQNEGRSLSELECIEDSVLGNGGLGRLAACFLDSAASMNLPIDGYGIRYRFGMFKQSIENGFQKEDVDDWTRFGDPWSIRQDDEAVKVEFSDGCVKAIPYDMPIIGYDTSHISTLRLWQCEPLKEFDFNLFNNQKYNEALENKNRAEDISRVLYPNDSTQAGKLLRLKQQYFFCSASLQDIIKKYKSVNGNDYSKFSSLVSIQLNDTHPVISVPELIRLLQLEGLSFDSAFQIAKEVFNYTNHTIMQEALEKWEIQLIRRVSFDAACIIEKISSEFDSELSEINLPQHDRENMRILQNNVVNMAFLACYVASNTNGVAEIHTRILKHIVLKDWYNLYPQKFQNKTNGITQRRWLCLCNLGLANLITSLLGNSNWIKDLEQLKELEKYAEDKEVLDKFIDIKQQNKQHLCDYVKMHDKKSFDTSWVMDVQIKRLHEYKRQFLNILAILELYFEIKEGALTDFKPTVFLFGAKSAPGYMRAKGIIKLINEVSKLIANDDLVSKYIQVIFVEDYNVTYAEKIISAADVSEQISTAGTEASGTGNMKLMLNGAVTIGTYDGANIEIVEEAGEENNYIFGARVEDIYKTQDAYCPRDLYNMNPKIKRCLDVLVNGTLSDGGTGIFKELYSSILDGSSWHKADHYYLLLDFEDFVKTKINLNNDSKDIYDFAKKGWLNMCNAGKFSSDRTISEYAKDIWNISSVL